jgi:hypothetical protein
MPIKFLAHRGLWFELQERNTPAALFRGLDRGYGLETDVRDLNGELVISHDLPDTASAIPVAQLLRYYREGGFTSTLGLNIKSDGLQDKLFDQLKAHKLKNYFVFDMSIPDTLGYLKRNLTTFIRRSELEHHPELALRSHGIWLDELLAPWIDSRIIVAQAALTNAICIVSGEVHGRGYADQWAHIARAVDAGCPPEKLMLCTDIPQAAEKFFQ